MSCTDDDAYISGSTNGVMNSCSLFIGWVESIGLDCNGHYSIGDISSICCRSCASASSENIECTDDDAFILSSSTGHFETCDTFVDWLYFVNQDCSYRIPGQNQRVSEVCCSTCLSREMVPPDPLLSPSIQPSAYCEDLSLQQEILEDYLASLEVEIQSITNATSSCNASISECELEYESLQTSCNQTHAEL